MYASHANTFFQFLHLSEKFLQIYLPAAHFIATYCESLLAVSEPAVLILPKNKNNASFLCERSSEAKSLEYDDSDTTALHLEFNTIAPTSCIKLQIALEFYLSQLLYYKILSSRVWFQIALFADTVTNDLLQKCREGKPPIRKWEQGKKGNYCLSMFLSEKKLEMVGQFFFLEKNLTRGPIYLNNCQIWC